MHTPCTPTIIRVFQEDEVWNNYAKWWEIPHDVLTRLHIATYLVDDDEKPRLFAAAVGEVRRRHPGAVLVY